MAGNITLIKDIANIKVGINLSRGVESVPEHLVYSLKDQEDDLISPVHNKPDIEKTDLRNYVINEGDIIVNLGVRLCSVVSRENSGKFIKNTFAKIEVEDSFIDPWFLCYFINMSNGFKQSISTEVMSVVRPLSAAILGNVEIKLPCLHNQKKIGLVYHNLCRIDYLKKRRKELLMKAICEISNID